MLLDVRVQPKSTRDSVEVVDGSKLKVHVMAAPEGGKANAAAIALLARRIGVAKRSIRIVRGHRSRDNQVDCEGLEREEVVRRLSSGR